MKKIIIFTILILLSSSFVSAGFWDWITGRATATCTTASDCPDLVCGGIYSDIQCENSICVPSECPPKDCDANEITPTVNIQKNFQETGTVVNDKDTFLYTHQVTPINAKVHWTVSQESTVQEVPNWYFRIDSDSNSGSIDGSEGFVYNLNFPIPLRSDIDQDCDLDDLDNKILIILGDEYTVVDTYFNVNSNGPLTIDFIGGATRYTMEEGQTINSIVNGINYKVTVLPIPETYPTPPTVQLEINEETTVQLNTGDIYTLNDKTKIGIVEILDNEEGDVLGDQVTFYLGAKKIKIQDSIGLGISYGLLYISDNSIPDAAVDILAEATGTCGNGEVNLESITIAFQQSDNYYVPVGGKLSAHTDEDQDIIDLLNALNIDYELTSLTGCSATVTFSAGEEESAPTPQCTDTDAISGQVNNLLEKGVCTDSTGTHEDECLPNGMLKEYRCLGNCNADALFNCNGQGFDSSYKCEDGRCVPTQESPEENFVLSNFKYEKTTFEGDTYLNIFMDIQNTGNLYGIWTKLDITVNSETKSILGKELNPKDSRTQHSKFLITDETNTVEIKLYDSHSKLTDSFSTILNIEEDKCTNNADCDDEDSSTEDLCKGSPKKCENINITSCTDGDGFCALGCTFDTDNDCSNPTECSKDADCGDDDMSTQDVCSGSPKKCSNTKITQCTSGDSYCPSDCDYQADSDCDQCFSDEDCDDNDVCSKDSCYGTPKVCSSEKEKSGCNWLDANACVPIGTRTKTQYCDVDDSLKDQKSKEESCNNNYECTSNLCVNSQCLNPSFVQKVINWFKSLFGG